MTRLSWGDTGDRHYEAGVDRGVLYVGTADGVPWQGLTSVEENLTGGEPRARYIDGVKYLNTSSQEEFGATVTAFTYPVQFEQCDGSAQARPGLFLGQQRRKPFGLSYRTGIGNDVDGPAYGYKVHIVYNALAAPTNRSHSTLGTSTDPSEFSWALTTKPPVVSGYARTSHIVVDSRYTHPITLANIEDILYGTESTAPKLPTIVELFGIFDTLVDLAVTDNGDGTALISGPDEAVQFFGDGLYSIAWDTVVQIDEDTYSISS